MESNLKPHILLLGCGYSLTYLAEILAKGSFVATTRSAQRMKSFVERGWSAEFFDKEDLESFRNIIRKYPSLRVMVDGISPPQSKLFLNELSKSSISRVVFLSTTGVSGVETGEWVNEETSDAPISQQAKARLEGERMYHEMIETTVLRIPAIYGLGRGIGQALKGEKYTLICDSERWTNRIHVEDLASAIKCVIESGYTKPLFYLADDAPSLQKEVVTFYCEQFALPYPKEISLEDARKNLHHTQLSNQRVSNALFKQEYKFSFRYPSYRDGAISEWEQGVPET